MTKQQKTLQQEFKLRKIVEHIKHNPLAQNFYGMSLAEAEAKHANACKKI